MCKSGVFVNCDSKPGAVHSATPAPVNKTRTLAEGRGRRVPGGEAGAPARPQGGPREGPGKAPENVVHYVQQAPGEIFSRNTGGSGGEWAGRVAEPQHPEGW